MKKLLIAALFAASAANATEYKAVFDLTTSSPATVENRIPHNIDALTRYCAKNGDTFKAAVIISGGAYAFFRNDSKIKQIAIDISKVAKVEVCSVGMKKRHIQKSDMLSFVTPAFSLSVTRTRGMPIFRYNS